MPKNSTNTPSKILTSIKQRSAYFNKHQYNFKARNNCTYNLLINGDQFYPKMLKDIQAAKKNIYIIQYIFQSGLTATEFINALIDASQRNVDVYLSLDAYGSNKLNQQDRYKLNNAGIKTFFYNPLKKHQFLKFLYRDHRKLLVIDGNTAFIGGAGISDDYNYPINHPSSWKDIIIKVTGELAKDCQVLAQQHIPIEETSAAIPLIKSNNLKTCIDICASQGRLLISKSHHRNEIQRAIITAITKSKHRIWITTPYFVPSRKLRKKLKSAAHNGCDVRLLLPGKISDHPWVSTIARNNYHKMLNAGVKIFEFQKSFSHAKAILCDDWTCIGSSNLDRWNQKFNYELNIEAQTSSLAEALTQFFESNFKESIQISAKLWQQRPFLQRLKEWFLCKLSIWIERFLNKPH